MKKISQIFIASAIMMSVHASAQEQKPQKKGWSYSVGLGGGYTPIYMGDDENRASFFPNLTAKYEDKFFASFGQGIGYNLINTESWQVGPVIKYDSGREEDASNAFSGDGDTTDLIGLGDVDGAVEMGAFAKYGINAMSFEIELRQALDSHEGLVGEASIQYKGFSDIGGQKVIYSFGPKISYTDGNYNKAYFGVNASQSSASGLAQYDADNSTLSYGIAGNLIIPHTKNVSSFLFASYTRLGDTISDSSLIQQRGSEDQSSVGYLLNYSF